MKFIKTIASTAFFMSAFIPAAIVIPITAAQANPSEDFCYDDGGIAYHKDGSRSWCEYPTVTTKPGFNPEGTQGSESTSTKETDGHGNINNDQETTSTCVRGNGKPC
jgi:hypothetical protein